MKIVHDVTYFIYGSGQSYISIYSAGECEYGHKRDIKGKGKYVLDKSTRRLNATLQIEFFYSCIFQMLL